LIAMCYWRSDRPAWAVDEAEELTSRLGDPSLQIEALNARWLTEFSLGRYREALEVAIRAFELERATNDPDAANRLRESALALFVLCGRVGDARRMVEEHRVTSLRLSPHHRLHTMAMEVELNELLGDWDNIRRLVPIARAAVAETVATPCVRGPRSLLVCA